MPFLSYDSNGNPIARTIMYPSESLQDPVNKLRVSTPQSLIDTDFEYGTQPTKWESLAMNSNRPTAFFDVTAPITITGISGAGTRVVTVLTTASLAVGTPVYIQDSTSTNANGWYLVDTTSGTQFTYIAKNTVVSASVFDITKTYVFTGTFYSGSYVPVSATAGAAFTNVGVTVTATTTNAHGLSTGNGIFVIGTTATTNAPNGAWVITSTPTSNTFTFVVVNAPTGTITATAGANASLYPRSLGASLHRSFDGGVTFSTGTPSPSNQLIRQTRRYFRYQSGKGIQFSTGTILKPTFQLDNITSSGTTVTVTTKFAHSIGAGVRVYVSGCNETDYNGTFTVVSTPSDTTFTYTALSTPSATIATGFPISCGLSSWNGSFNRLGMFDTQNGFFFESDGQQLFAVRRKSTDQLSGTVAVTNGSNTVTGTNTKFSSQLMPGDMIVIRGMSYEISTITSDTQMFICPEYRGSTITGNCIISKTIDIKVPQSSWNIDKCDGTGFSGFNLDLTKMQMFYIDYTWYGAGSIRFGFRGADGNAFYAHKIVNANVNTEAYMRSGNLPARYEISNTTYYTTLRATLSSAITTGGTITVDSTANFPASGQLLITASGNTGAPIEIISYTSKTATTFIVGSRTQTGGNAVAQTFTYSATAPVPVELYAPEAGSILSHWGSSVIMDGRFDDDKSFIFQAGMTSAISNVATGAGTNNALLGLRLSPSVDSGLTGVLGSRDLINRMQLALYSMGLAVTAGATTPVIFLIKVILNGRLSTASGNNWVSPGGSSLSQIMYCASGTTVAGGETIYSFFMQASPNASSNDSFDLTKVRDLATSILGGGTVNTGSTTGVNTYPDGPDVVYITATNVSSQATNSLNARISWTEAQA